MQGNGLTGLANLGNTCFINSCMQVLSHTYELNVFLDKDDGNYKNKLAAYHNIDYILDSKLLVEWDNLRKLMWQKDQLISPGGFIKAIQYVAKHKKKDIFTGYAQNDLPEFLLFLLQYFFCAHRACLGCARERFFFDRGFCITGWVHSFFY